MATNDLSRHVLSYKLMMCVNWALFPEPVTILFISMGINFRGTGLNPRKNANIYTLEIYLLYGRYVQCTIHVHTTRGGSTTIGRHPKSCTIIDHVTNALHLDQVHGCLLLQHCPHCIC